MVEIGEPDDELLAQVLVKLLADRQLAVDDRLIGYIVARMERSLEAAQTIVERLDHLALARGTRIKPGARAGSARHPWKDTRNRLTVIVRSSN